MPDQLFNGILATALGTAVAVVLLIPVAAVEYRRDGRLGPRDLTVLLAGAVYGLALWTYTLLPMPADGDFTCVGRQTVLFDTIGAIDWSQFGSRAGISALVRDAAFLQVALNVMLFVPLGYFVRRLARRGVVVATLLGFGTSLLIETTQTTGVWHLYDCAYRLFDVDDLMINTIGATIGSLVAAIFIRRQRPEVVWPTSITFGRRLMGMVSDALFVLLLSSAIAIAWRAVQIYVLDVAVADLPTDEQRLWQWGIPALCEVVCVLVGGRTIGEWVVAVRTVPRRGGPVLLARMLKLLTGLGPALVLLALSESWAAPLATLWLVIAALAAIPAGGGHRGLSHTVAGLDLEIVPRDHAPDVRVVEPTV